MADVTERRADTVALSGQAKKISVVVLSAFIVGVGSVLWGVINRTTANSDELKHMRQIEQLRHESIARDLADIAEELRELQNFQNHGPRFTAGDGKRHEKRIDSLEAYVASHEAWGRELTGKWTAQLENCRRRVDRLEKWQGVHD